MTNPELDPTIREVATIYGFGIKFDEELEKWIIKYCNMGEHFYWSSSEDKEDFFDELKKYFYILGLSER